MLKINILMVYFFSIIMALSSNSLFFIWVCMELNMMMFIPTMKKMNFSMTNSMLKYFIIQSLASNIFLFFLLLNKTNFMSFYYPNMMMFWSMWMKLGFFPFSSWYFQITTNMEWLSWTLINTLQKLIPLWIISFNLIDFPSLNLILMINSMYSLTEIINQNSLRWLINASSINHFNWMIVSMNSNCNIWEIYYLTYLILSTTLFLTLKNSNWNTSLSMNINTDLMNPILMFILMMNLMGIPPFLGFIPKLLILLKQHLSFLFLLLILNTLMIMIYYFNLISPMMKIKLNSKLIISPNNSLFTPLTLSLFLFYTFIFFI